MSTSEDIIKVLGVSTSDTKTTFNISNKSGKTISVLVGMPGNDISYYSGTNVENTLKPTSYDGDSTFVKAPELKADKNLFFNMNSEVPSNIEIWSNNDLKLATISPQDGTVEYTEVALDSVPDAGQYDGMYLTANQVAKLIVKTHEAFPGGGGGGGIIHNIVVTTEVLKEGGTGTDGKFNTGDKVYVKVTLENKGSIPEVNVSIPIGDSGFAFDEVKGHSEQVSLSSTNVKVSSIPVNGQVYFHLSHTVTSDDLLNGSKLTFEASSDNGGFSGTVEIPTGNFEEVIHKLLMTSQIDESSQHTGLDNKYTTGNKVIIKVTVTNQGNVPEYGISIPLSSSGFTYDAKAPSSNVSNQADTVSISSIAVKASEYFYIDHIIAESDLGVGYSKELQGTYTNGVLSSVIQIPSSSVEVRRQTATGTKTITNSPASQKDWTVNEIPQWEIKIQNTGNVTLNSVEIEELLSGATFVSGSGYTIE